LDNAVKYTPPHGRIVVTVGRRGADAVVRVTDSGIGIPDDMLPRIFEPFIQVSGSQPRAGGGLGLGLALVRGLVELHGGIEMARLSRPEIALVDIGLPGFDGYQVAERLRAAPAGRGVFLVALSGYGQAEDRRRALAAGFDVHLLKPVDPEELARVLAEMP